MILSPYLLKFAEQQSSEWHMVVSQEKTVQLGSRSMLTLWRHLWKELIESDLCIPSQYGFSLDVVLLLHRESPRSSPQGQSIDVGGRYIDYGLLWAEILVVYGLQQHALVELGTSGQGTVVPSLGGKVQKSLCVEGKGKKNLGKLNSSFNYRVPHPALIQIRWTVPGGKVRLDGP